MAPADVWDRGDAYEEYVGRLSREVADLFVRWLDVPAGGRWLDVGCGTGALAAAVLSRCAPETVDAVDPSAAFLEFARRRLPAHTVRLRVADASRLPFADGSFDASAAGLVLNFLPDALAGVAELARVTRPGGIVGAYVWDYAGGMEVMRLFWDAAIEADPGARELDEGRRFPLCREERLAELFSQAGLVDVATRPIEVTAGYPSFDDYWRPFLGGQGPAPGYAVALPPERREELRQRLRARTPHRPDGRVELAARALAVRGRRSDTP